MRVPRRCMRCLRSRPGFSRIVQCLRIRLVLSCNLANYIRRSLAITRSRYNVVCVAFALLSPFSRCVRVATSAAAAGLVAPCLARPSWLDFNLDGIPNTSSSISRIRILRFDTWRRATITLILVRSRSRTSIVRCNNLTLDKFGRSA